MAELKNTFSWSFSAAEDFSECRRRRYWAKYAMWGGWREDAAELQKTAYRLAKMENRFSILGNAVERAVMWALREKQAGRDAGVDDAYEAEARPYLNRCWSESKGELWRQSPKKFCCLKEHYYREFDSASENEAVGMIKSRAKTCVSHFIESVLPRISGIPREREVAVARIEGGDPESFLFEGVKVYAIPDHVYLDGEIMHIHDWKAGREKDSHYDQVALYALWANVRHGRAPESIRTHVEYLGAGRTATVAVTAERIERVKKTVRESVAEMTEYLVAGDRARNEPMPAEDWELTAEGGACRKCNFLELCRPELGSDG